MGCFIGSKKRGNSGGSGSKDGVEDKFILANPVGVRALEVAEFVASMAGHFFTPVTKSMRS